jgi:hypothetical protein
MLAHTLWYSSCEKELMLLLVMCVVLQHLFICSHHLDCLHRLYSTAMCSMFLFNPLTSHAPALSVPTPEDVHYPRGVSAPSAPILCFGAYNVLFAPSSSMTCARGWEDLDLDLNLDLDLELDLNRNLFTQPCKEWNICS